MSERTYAPRSGGRTAEPRGRDKNASGDDTRRSGTRREQAVPSADSVRDSDRASRGQKTGDGRSAASGRDSDQGRGIRAARDSASGRGAARDRTPASSRGTGLDRAARTTRADRVGRSEKLDRAERLNRSDRATGAGRNGETGERLGRVSAAAVRADVRSRRPEAMGGRGTAAPVDGTAALQIGAVEAEPLPVIELDRAPRLQVAPPAPISGPRAPFVAGVIGVVIAGVLGILLINTKTNENSFRISDLQKQSATLDNQAQDLDNQLATVSSPGNLDAAARRLGLVKATPAQIRLPDGKVIGVLTPADGKTSVTAQGAATGAPADEDKGAANIVPDNPSVTQPGLTPNGTGGTPTTGLAGTGTAGTGTGTAGLGTAGLGTAGTGTAGTGTTGTETGTNGDGAAANGVATGGVPSNGAGQ